MARYKSNELRPTNRGVRDFIESSKVLHALLKLVAVFGVSLIMADGILTPAQSVLGAIQGICWLLDADQADCMQASALLTRLYLCMSLSVSRALFSFCCTSCSHLA